MKMRIMILALLAAAAVLAIRAGISPAQRGYRGLPAGDGSRVYRGMVPDWTVDEQFQDDVFTFARVRYDSWRRGNKWATDYPDSDLNFSFRLQQLTSLKVHPDGVIIELTDPRLFDYPFIYMCEPGDIILNELQATALRRYLLNGGFLMADDFWAPQSWRHVRQQMKRVFPDREPRELSPDHEIFHMVYDLKGKLQVPSIFAWQQGDTFEYWHGDPEGDEDPHFWGYFDDDGHLMALFCHNNDIGDGWEREGVAGAACGRG